MPAKYKLVLRKDMRKGAEADAKLYYANAKAAGTVGIQELCDLIAEGSTASAGDVKLILDELIRVMRRSLGKGEVVQVGELGNFQLQFGSTGTLTEKEFNSALIKSKRICSVRASSCGMRSATTPSKRSFPKLRPLLRAGARKRDRESFD